jgi:hypothetical protein
MAEASGEEKRARRQSFPHQEMQQSKFEVGQSDLYTIRSDYTRPPGRFSSQLIFHSTT